MRYLLALTLSLLLALNLALGLAPCPTAAAPLPPRRLPPGGQLAAGLNHTLLLRADGTLYASGTNAAGQLGTGTTTQSYVPVPVAQGAVPAGVRLVQVAAGSQHSLALGTNGRVYAWGDNGTGQLGTGNTNAALVPVAVSLPADVRIVQVAAGSQHSLALAANGTVYAWGYNNYGQLGYATPTSTSLVPTAVAQGALPAGTRLVQVAAGVLHSLALAADGTAYAWGRNANGQLGNNSTTNSTAPVAVAPGALPTGTRLVQLSAGYLFSLALAADGTAYAWGFNGFGQLGNNSTATSLVPVAVAQGSRPAGSQLVQVMAGSSHALALAADGTAYAWGYNEYGQTGTGTSSTSPLLVPGLVATGALPAGIRLARLAAGCAADHSLALAADGTACAWGWGFSGELGNGGLSSSSVPVLPGLPGRVSGYQQAAAGGNHSLALHADGSLYAWGSNFFGQLGTGTTTDSSVPVAVSQGALPAAGRWAQATAGGGYSVALSDQGLAYAWGNNEFGQLGDNSPLSRPAPVAVAQGALPAGLRLVQVSAGYRHTLALAADGTAYAWGYNVAGRLGDGSTTQRFAPVAVVLPAGVRLVQVAAGYDHSLGLAADGTVYAWGNNTYGQLGDGTATSHATPTAIGQGALPAGTRLVQVAAGGQHSLALAADGTVYAWGFNNYGQLGDGTFIQRPAPVAVEPGARAPGQPTSQVVAGYGHSLLLAADGTIFGWGNGQYGQLGINAFSTAVLIPVPEASGLVLWRGLASSATAYHSLVLGEGSAVYSAGQNTSGQLGDNTTTNSPVFIRSRVVLPVRAGQPAAGPALYPNPNPAPGAARLSGAAPGQPVQVLDALGRLVATATVGPDGTAALGGLAPGLYLVRVGGGGSVRLAVE